MTAPTFTPGPWRWELNMASKGVQLCGGRPSFDKTVMEFSRWGMGGAAPRFQDPKHPHRLMTRADRFGVVVVGREHHSGWFQDIDQPDARLIATAPELHEALAHFVNSYPAGDVSTMDGVYMTAYRALRKARGET